MPTAFQLVRLEEILHAEIPLSVQMGLEIIPEGDGFVLEAPLAPNRNLQGTFFGGSLSALGLLAGWSWLQLALRELQLEPDIVVQRSSEEFVAPARGRTRARVLDPEPERWDRFLRTLRRKGKGRVAVEIVLESPVPHPLGPSAEPEGTAREAERHPPVSGRFPDPGELPTLDGAVESGGGPVEVVQMIGWYAALERR